MKGEILSQEPHFSLQKKDIYRRIETMTPAEFKNWALYAPLESGTEASSDADPQISFNHDSPKRPKKISKNPKKLKTKTLHKKLNKSVKKNHNSAQKNKNLSKNAEKYKNPVKNSPENEESSSEPNSSDDEAESESSSGSKSQCSSDEDENEVVPLRRSLRKTPTRILKEQMDRINKQKSDFLESGRHPNECYAERVLRRLVSTGRIAIWLKQQTKGGTKRSRVKKKRFYFATKKAIQWKSLSFSKARVAAFSKLTKEEDAFFERKDEHNMSPQEERVKRDLANELMANQVFFFVFCCGFRRDFDCFGVFREIWEVFGAFLGFLIIEGKSQKILFDWFLYKNYV